jgi:hypothetical protein
MRIYETPSVHLPVSRLMDGFLVTQLLCAAAKLNIADALASGPQAAKELAQSKGVSPDPLHRMLRGLAAVGVLDELSEGRFGLSASGRCLRSDVPDSLRGAIIARGDLYYSAAAGLFEAVTHGGVPFECVHGTDFFSYQARRAESGATFQAWMEDRARDEVTAMLAAYDFTGFERLVDVGGGRGVMLAAILTAVPHMHGTLLELPPVVGPARGKLEEAGLSARCDVVAGDFFETVPTGGEAYLLSRIVHDWDDEAALRILCRCRKAMAPGATLLLVDLVLPELAKEHSWAIRMDLLMFTLLGGRERTANEFDRLLAAAGFRLTRIVPTRATTGVSVIEAR